MGGPRVGVGKRKFRSEGGHDYTGKGGLVRSCRWIVNKEDRKTTGEGREMGPSDESI